MVLIGKKEKWTWTRDGVMVLTLNSIWKLKPSFNTYLLNVKSSAFKQSFEKVLDFLSQAAKVA